MAIAVRTLQVEDKQTNRALGDQAKALNDLGGSAILAGQQIDQVHLPDAAAVAIPHRLERKWTNWIKTRESATSGSGRIQEVPSSGDPTKTLVLKASGYGGTVVVSLWIY